MRNCENDGEEMFRKLVCRHEFNIEDIELVEYEEPMLSVLACYQQGLNYYEQRHIKERIKCACRKCGKIFKKHCGVDLVSHGKLTRELI